jgi:hypothetical protein
LIRFRSRARRSTVGEADAVPVTEAIDVDKGKVEDGVSAPDKGEAVLDSGEDHGLVLDDSPGLMVPLLRLLRAPLATILLRTPLGGEGGREAEFDVMNKFSSSLSLLNPRADRACILDFFRVSLD